MNSDVVNVDLNVINHYKSLLEDEKRNFDYTTYSIFESCYLNNCSDEYIKMLALKLSSIYDEINKEYTNVLNWWTEYIDNFTSLEGFLSGDSSVGLISNSIIRNYASSKFEDYNNLD